MGLIPMDMDLLPPSDDRVFKLLMTAPDSKPVLIDLIAAIIRRAVIDVVVRNNELPLGDTDEKAARLDVNCIIDDGSQVAMEMQASYIEELGIEHKNLKGKSIYYMCDLHSSQSSKGKRYEELAQTYQVTFCCYTVFPELPVYVNSFSMRHDITNELLSDAVHVIYIELSKLKEILKKSVDEMTDLEKWAVFFRYANIPKYRETINKVIASKEALKMAGESLMSVSKDERERAIFRSRRMYQSDQDSNLATAEYRGILIGEQRGEQKAALVIAGNMLKRNKPIEEIVEDTGLTREEVANLRITTTQE